MVFDDSCDSRGSNQGFTLIELIVVIIIIAIAAILSAPSFMGIIERNNTANALTVLRGALQEAQRQSIKTSKECIVNLEARGTKDPTITSDCFVTGPRTLKGVYLTYNNASNKISFNERGGISQLRTLIIYASPGDVISPNNQRCLVVSNRIGMMRAGNHNPPKNFNPLNTSTIDGNKNCVSNK
jgi:prepilin-type N-terminal cleavage/methylation domain-containing protein